MSDDIRRIIEKASQHILDRDRPRAHLGASEVGARCVRKSWYKFRWSYIEKHTGRILRLFDRGQDEEVRLIRWLRAADAEIREYSERLLYHDTAYSDSGIEPYYECVDWEYEKHGGKDVSNDPHHIALATKAGAGPKQWSFTDHGGHFAGSGDGKIRAEWLPDGWGLVEFKTHNEKSFKDLSAKGVVSSKPIHYVQMQVYMLYLDLPWGLYLAVDKNSDEIYPEIIWRKDEVGKYYSDIAAKVTEAKSAPPRITDDPSWFECRFCEFREICHYGKQPQKNCRSCIFASAEADGSWYCGRHHGTLPFDFIPKGCDDWEPIV